MGNKLANYSAFGQDNQQGPYESSSFAASSQETDIARKSIEPVVRTADSKIITVIVDDNIQFEVDITDKHGDLTCGWLLSEVTRKYTVILEALYREEYRNHRQAQQQEVRMPRQKRRYIVALKTKDLKEGLDSWLNQYERNLSVIRDGSVLIAHFAKLNRRSQQKDLAQRQTITIDDFEQMRVIGRGGFSRVILARKKDTGRLYAIKILRKDQLVNENKTKPILSERRVMEELGDHPFLIKLHWAFQSSRELYFVMDICTGGELFFHLLQQRRFSEKLAKFYMCEILLGFKYMHEKDIVYRDIKPENILIDTDGHIRIADFGLSKQIRKHEKSHSFCGSPEYLSPEMLQNNEGHDRRLDIYCLGVLLYEMITGLPPFYDEDHQKMFQKIVTAEPKLTQPYISKQVKDLLARMLKRDPEARCQSIEEVMAHEWFDGVDWDQVLSKQVIPPLQPDINSCYFENDSGEDGDAVDCSKSSFSVYKATQTGNNATKSMLRRQSYYIHSTIHLPSCADERHSFLMRSPSPSYIRQLLDSSSFQATNYMNDSTFMQNLQTSMLDGKVSLLKKQESMRAASRVMGGSNNYNSNQPQSDNFLNDSELPKILEFTDNNPFQISDAFQDFDFAEPPLAELQILRVLDSHIKRKRKDHLEKARKFKEELLKQKQRKARNVSISLTRNIEANKITSQTSQHPRNSQQKSRKLNGKSGDLLTRSNPIQGRTMKDRIPEQTETSSQFESKHHQRNRHELDRSSSLQKIVDREDETATGCQIFSDSETYMPFVVRKSQRQKTFRKSFEELPVANEFQKFEWPIGGEQVAKEQPKPQNCQVPSNAPMQSLDTFRTEPEQMLDPPSIIDYCDEIVDEKVPHTAFHQAQQLNQFLEDKVIDQNFFNLQLPIERSSSHHSSQQSASKEGASLNQSARPLVIADVPSDEVQLFSSTQKPLQSGKTVSIKKIKAAQAKKMHSGEIASLVHGFGSELGERNVSTALKHGYHKSLNQERQPLTEDVDESQAEEDCERNADSPLLAISKLRQTKVIVLQSLRASQDSKTAHERPPNQEFPQSQQLDAGSVGSGSIAPFHASTYSQQPTDSGAKLSQAAVEQVTPETKAQLASQKKQLRPSSRMTDGLISTEDCNGAGNQNSTDVVKSSEVSSSTGLKLRDFNLASLGSVELDDGAEAGIREQDPGYFQKNRIDRSQLMPESVPVAAHDSSDQLSSTGAASVKPSVKDSSRLPSRKNAGPTRKKDFSCAKTSSHVSSAYAAQSLPSSASAMASPKTSYEAGHKLKAGHQAQKQRQGNRLTGGSQKNSAFASSCTSSSFLLKKPTMGSQRATPALKEAKLSPRASATKEKQLSQLVKQSYQSQAMALMTKTASQKAKRVAIVTKIDQSSQYLDDGEQELLDLAEDSGLVADETDSRPSLNSNSVSSEACKLTGVVRLSGSGQTSMPQQRLAPSTLSTTHSNLSAFHLPVGAPQSSSKLAAKNSVSPEPIRRGLADLSQAAKKKVDQSRKSPQNSSTRKAPSIVQPTTMKLVKKVPQPGHSTLSASSGACAKSSNSRIPSTFQSPRQSQNPASTAAKAHQTNLSSKGNKAGLLAHKPAKITGGSGCTQVYKSTSKTPLARQYSTSNPRLANDYQSGRASCGLNSVHQKIQAQKFARKRSAAHINIDLCSNHSSSTHNMTSTGYNSNQNLPMSIKQTLQVLNSTCNSQTEASKFKTRGKSSEKLQTTASFIGSFRKKLEGASTLDLRQEEASLALQDSSHNKHQLKKKKSSHSLNTITAKKRRPPHHVTLTIEALKSKTTGVSISQLDQSEPSRNAAQNTERSGNNNQTPNRTQEQMGSPQMHQEQPCQSAAAVHTELNQF